MPTFGDLASELTGRLPGLSPFLAETFITRAWSTIRGERLWGFLQFDGAVVCPALISAGTFSFTQYTNTATANAAASAALAAVTGVSLTSLQIRFMGLGQTSQIYSITAVDTTAPAAYILTLDRLIQEPTNAASQYMVYRAYIVPPMSDFLRFESLVDMVNGIRIVNDRLTLSSAHFDIRDPQRQAFGLSYYLGFFQATSSTDTTAADAAPRYELWPGSTQGQNFYARFRRRGTDPAMSDVLPPQISTETVIARALAEHGYAHVAANIGFFPNFKGANFQLLINNAWGSYRDGLRSDKKQDDEQNLQTVFDRGHGLRRTVGSVGFPYPIDSNFFQSHPVFW